MPKAEEVKYLRETLGISLQEEAAILRKNEVKESLNWLVDNAKSLDDIKSILKRLGNDIFKIEE
jgi:hypothetical protein